MIFENFLDFFCLVVVTLLVLYKDRKNYLIKKMISKKFLKKWVCSYLSALRNPRKFGRAARKTLTHKKRRPKSPFLFQMLLT